MSVCPEETAGICKEEMEVSSSWKEGHRSSGSTLLWGKIRDEERDGRAK